MSSFADFLKLKHLIDDNQRFLLISHRGPDGDTLGSNLALRFMLLDMNKKVTSACIDQISDKYQFLDDIDCFVDSFNLADFDIIITVDIATEGLLQFTSKYPQLLKGDLPVVNIDHHKDNKYFGTLNIVIEEASTTVIIYDFINYLRWSIDIKTATALLTGIYFDTGGLMHSNTCSNIYRITSDLISKGADFKNISKHLFQTIPLNRLKLWGRILERVYMNDDQIVYASITPDDYSNTNTTSDDSSGIIDYLNMAVGAKCCVLLNENNEKQLVKGSLRTLAENVDVSKIAHKLDGGGHAKASGFAKPGRLVQEIRWKVVNE